MSLSDLVLGQSGFAVAYLLTFGALVVADNIPESRRWLARNCFLSAYVISLGITMAWAMTTRANYALRDVLTFVLAGSVAVAALETYQYFAGHPRESQPLPPVQKPIVTLADILRAINELKPIQSAIHQHEQQVYSNPTSGTVAQNLLDQYEKLDKAANTFANLSGAQKEDLLPKLIEDARMVQNNAGIEATHSGGALILKLGANTFRVIFPVPMRIAPKVSFLKLPDGVEAKIIQVSNVEFTVIFWPLSTPISAKHFPTIIADAEL